MEIHPSIIRYSYFTSVMNQTHNTPISTQLPKLVRPFAKLLVGSYNDGPHVLSMWDPGRPPLDYPVFYYGAELSS